MNKRGYSIKWQRKNHSTEWRLVSLVQYSLAKYGKDFSILMGYDKQKLFLEDFAKVLTQYGWKTKRKPIKQIMNSLIMGKPHFLHLVNNDDLSKIKNFRVDQVCIDNFNEYSKFSLDQIVKEIKKFMEKPYDLSENYVKQASTI